MQNDVTLTEDDEGKDVVNSNGDEVGRVIEVTHGEGHVEPDPGIADTIKTTLGWGEADGDTYRLSASDIEHVTDDEIRLNR